MKYIVFTLIALSSLFSGCKKDKSCLKFEEGTLSGLCGRQILLDNGTWLSPTNLKEFNDNIEFGKRLRISYHEVAAYDVCQMGIIAEIDCLIEL